jgi:hypothetical protein
MYTCTRVCTHTRTHSLSLTHTRAHAHTDTHAHTYTSTHTHRVHALTRTRTHVHTPGLPLPMASAWVGSALLGALLCSAQLSVQSCSALRLIQRSISLKHAPLCRTLFCSARRSAQRSAFSQRIALLSTLFCSTPLCSVFCSILMTVLHVMRIKNEQNKKIIKAGLSLVSTLPRACSRPLHCALVLCH